MRVYMTNGTLSYLYQLSQKYPNLQFFFMRNEQGVLAYYEGTKKRVFSAGRTYQALESFGQVKPYGYVMTEHIPVQSDSKPVFEQQLSFLKERLKKVEGVLSFRLLKQRWRNHYVIFTQWNHKKDFELWLEDREEIQVKYPAYFLNRRFSVGYRVIDDEELEEFIEQLKSNL